MNTLAQYLDLIVDPTFNEFHIKPDERLAFLASVAIFHSVDLRRDGRKGCLTPAKMAQGEFRIQISRCDSSPSEARKKQRRKSSKKQVGSSYRAGTGLQRGRLLAGCSQSLLCNPRRGPVRASQSWNETPGVTLVLSFTQIRR